MRKRNHGLGRSIVTCVVTLALPVCAAAQIHVAPTGSDGNPGTAASPLRTIAHAANVAAPGSTIHLHAGVYGDEQGIVQLGTKDLVLEGADPATTILVPHATSTLPLAGADPAAAAMVPHRIGILIAGTARVHLRRLTIDAQGFAPAGAHLAGLYLRGGADVVCDRVTVRNCQPVVLGGTTAHGVVVRGDLPTDPTTLALRNCTLTNFGTGGVRASLRAEIDLQECAVAGAGAASATDQVGVWLQDVAIGSIRLSRITDCGGPTGAAIRLQQHGAGCLVEANRVARAATGIDVRHVPPLIVPGSIRHNRVAAVDTTIRVTGTAGLFVTGNALFSRSRLDPVPFFDDTSGQNVWSQNRFAIAPGTASVPIPGGGNEDLAPVAGTSELADVERLACGGAPIAVVVGDFDGDGATDFATLDLVANDVGLTIGLQRPGGFVTSPLPFGGAGLRPVALATGSFDAVPGVDLVALTAPVPPATAGAALWVFHNDGTGAMSLLHHEPLPDQIAPAALAAARLDGDLRDDVVVTDAGAWPFVAGRADVYRNGGSGTTWLAAPVPIAFTAAVTSVAAGDVDGDGTTDLTFAEGGPATGRMHWLSGDGFGGFTPSLGSPFTTPPQPTRVLVADVDGDGDRDIVVAATAGALPFQRGALQVFENRPSVLFVQAPIALERGPAQLCVADLDDDAIAGQSRPELLILHPTAGTVTLFAAYERTTGHAGGGTIPLLDTPTDLVAADLDGDAYTDAIAAEPARGGVAVLHGRPTAQVETFGTGCPGTGGRIPRLELRGTPGLPTLPNPTFAIGLIDSYPISFAVCAIALGRNPFGGPCGYLLDLPIFLLNTLVDADGRGAFGLPLVPMPDLYGLTFTAQAAAFDFAATTSFLPQFSLTAGLSLRVGD